MLYGEIIAVCSQIHTKHINTLCGQNVDFVVLNLMIHKATTGLSKFKIQQDRQCNIHARSLNYCCCGKAISFIFPSVCVCVCVYVCVCVCVYP